MAYLDITKGKQISKALPIQIHLKVTEFAHWLTSLSDDFLKISNQKNFIFLGKV